MPITTEDKNRHLDLYLDLTDAMAAEEDWVPDEVTMDPHERLWVTWTIERFITNRTHTFCVRGNSGGEAVLSVFPGSALSFTAVGVGITDDDFDDVDGLVDVHVLHDDVMASTIETVKEGVALSRGLVDGRLSIDRDIDDRLTVRPSTTADMIAARATPVIHHTSPGMRGHRPGFGIIDEVDRSSTAPGSSHFTVDKDGKVGKDGDGGWGWMRNF